MAGHGLAVYLPRRKDIEGYTPFYHFPCICVCCVLSHHFHTLLNGVWIFRHLDSIFPRSKCVITPQSKVVLILSAETDHVLSIYTPVSSLPIHIE